MPALVHLPTCTPLKVQGFMVISSLVLFGLKIGNGLAVYPGSAHGNNLYVYIYFIYTLKI